jgi:hypothetical protein
MFLEVYSAFMLFFNNKYLYSLVSSFHNNKIIAFSANSLCMFVTLGVYKPLCKYI